MLPASLLSCSAKNKLPIGDVCVPQQRGYRATQSLPGLTAGGLNHHRYAREAQPTREQREWQQLSKVNQPYAFTFHYL